MEAEPATRYPDGNCRGHWPDDRSGSPFCHRAGVARTVRPCGAGRGERAARPRGTEPSARPDSTSGPWCSSWRREAPTPAVRAAANGSPPKARSCPARRSDCGISSALLAPQGPADLLPLSGRLGRRGGAGRTSPARAHHDGRRRAHLHGAVPRVRARGSLSAADRVRRPRSRRNCAPARGNVTPHASSLSPALRAGAFPPGAILGIHSARLDAKLRQQAMQRSPGLAEISLSTCTRACEQYLAAMGIDPALQQLAAKVDTRRMYVLSRDEIARFGIVPGERFETPWMSLRRSEQACLRHQGGHARTESGAASTAGSGAFSLRARPDLFRLSSASCRPDEIGHAAFVRAVAATAT